MALRYQHVIHTINRATETTTGMGTSIAEAERVSFIFKRSNHASGSTAFTVEVSMDPVETADASSTWIAYNKLIDNVTNTNAQQLTRVASKSLASDTVVTVSMSPEDTYSKIRVIATETTDGTHDAWIIIQR